MENFLKKFLLIILILSFTSFFIFSQNNEESKTIVILLDKSTSMVEEIQSVKDYMFEVVDSKINIGDNLIIIPFYGRNDSPISLTVKSVDDKNFVKNRLKKIFATGFYTDIGNALDILKVEVGKLASDTNKKSLILITDGKHDPPPSTQYKSKEDYANDEFLLKAREEIVKEGWKVIYLDIGGHSDPEVVDQLATHYVKTEEGLPKDVLTKELKEKSPDLATQIGINGKVIIKPVNQKGESKLIIPVKIENLKNTEVMSIDKVELEQLIIFKTDIADAPYIKKFTEDGEKKIEIPLLFSGDLKPGKYKDTIKFSFSEDTKEHFDRRIEEVEFRINNFFQNYLWIFLLIIILILALIIFALYLLYTYLSKPKIKFRVIVEEAPLPEGKDVFKVVQGKFLYLTEDSGNISLLKIRSLSSLARIGCAGKRLKMTVLNDDKIPAGRDIPTDVAGFKFAIITDKTQQYHVRFEKL
ncbi:MAG: VWA domain-containing protein [Spirochaetes bacterium]|nr:VWA domain-containing protein [Spirochaetota bacterium]